MLSEARTFKSAIILHQLPETTRHRQSQREKVIKPVLWSMCIGGIPMWAGGGCDNWWSLAAVAAAAATAAAAPLYRYGRRPYTHIHTGRHTDRHRYTDTDIQADTHSQTPVQFPTTLSAPLAGTEGFWDWQLLHVHSATQYLSLRFIGNFPGEPELASVYWSKVWWRWWWQLEL